MKIWKVILPTLVIFAAGLIAGGVLVKFLTPPPGSGFLPQQFFQNRLKKELQLDADQTNRLDKIFVESNARRKVLEDLIGPEMRKERQEVHDEIRAILTPVQREKFEQLLKQPPHRPDGQRRGPRPNTNQTNSASAAVK